MIGIIRNLIFFISLAAFLSTACTHVTGPEQRLEEISPEDRAFLDSILSSLKSMTGDFERMVGPFVFTDAGVTRVDIDRFSGDRSFFIRLGNIVDNRPSVAHQVISTLIDSLDDMAPTKVTYRGKAVPLGVMCLEALLSICYYEASDKNGNITAWEGTVFPGATKEELRTAKRAWKRILKKRAYIML